MQIFVILLVCASIFVNGWTDAPNALTTVVSTRVLTPRKAVLLAAVFNLLGVLLMGTAVAKTISNIIELTPGKEGLITLAAAQLAIVTWSVGAWRFGIPTSESHALIAGLSGAAIALQGGLGGINGGEWVKVLYGLLLSSVLGFAMGWVTVKLVELVCRFMDKRKTDKFFKQAQIGGAAAMAFMHGAQDGQKFISVFLLGMFLTKGVSSTEAVVIPIWLMVVCALVMGLGTSIGGYRIIKAVGMDMVKLSKYQGFSADLAAAGCLLISSITGIPVSTTHTKTTSIMGVGAAKNLKQVNWGIVREMVLTWFLTFPGCGLLGFLMAKLFMMLF